MTKKDLIKEFDRLIKAHYNNEIDSRDEWLREIIWLKDEVVEKLTIPAVAGQSEQLANFGEWISENNMFETSLTYKEIAERYLIR